MIERRCLFVNSGLLSLVVPCAALAIASEASGAPLPSYVLRPLLTEPLSALSGSPFFSLQGIDNSGHALVIADDFDPATPLSYRWDGSTLTDFLPRGWFGGRMVSTGVVLCRNYVDDPTDTTPFRSAVWRPDGTFIELLAPVGTAPGTGVLAQGLNARGEASGYLTDGRVIRWDPDGTPHDLGVPPTGFTVPFINDAGELYGYTGLTYTDSGFVCSGFIGWGDGLRLFDVPGMLNTRLLDMNADGAAISLSFGEQLGSAYAQVIEAGGSPRVLPSLNARFAPSPRDINNSGWVVGSSFLEAANGDAIGPRAVLWTPELEPHPLLGLVADGSADQFLLQYAGSINDAGAILVMVQDIRPDTPLSFFDYPAILYPLTPIPEPATLGVLALVAGTMLCSRRVRS